MLISHACITWQHHIIITIFGPVQYDFMIGRIDRDVNIILHVLAHRDHPYSKWSIPISIPNSFLFFPAPPIPFPPRSKPFYDRHRFGPRVTWTPPSTITEESFGFMRRHWPSLVLSDYHDYTYPNLLPFFLFLFFSFLF